MDQTSIHWGQTFRRRQQLLEDSTNLERAISSPDANLALIEQLGGRLADSVLPEIHSGPTPLTKLYLEADPSLQNLPWPAMPTRLGPLGLIYPMTDLRSILADREAPPPLANGSSGELIIGASTASQGLAPLPEAMEEARLVSQYAHAPRLLIGEQATSVQLAKALDSATSLHFAGHAVQNSKGTRLLLASASPTDPAPWIDGAFLRRHPPRYCKLAILDACATGRRNAGWNSPLQDIVETLGAIGVEDVVATRWQIDSNAAVPFMRSLYDNLARGKDISVALLEARKLQSNRSQDNTPYYWAAYYVTETENARTESRQHGRK